MSDLLDRIYLANKLLDIAIAAIWNAESDQDELSMQFFAECAQLIGDLEACIEGLAEYENQRHDWESSYATEMQNLSDKLDNPRLHNYSIRYRHLMHDCRGISAAIWQHV